MVSKRAHTKKKKKKKRENEKKEEEERKTRQDSRSGSELTGSSVFTKLVVWIDTELLYRVWYSTHVHTLVQC